MTVLGLHIYRGKEMLCSPADECVTRAIQSGVKRLCEEGGDNADKTLF